MDKVKEQILKRLSIVEGHLKKIRKMVENEEYCPDVIHQSQAVQAALRKIDEIVLHGHLHSCVLHDIHETKSQKEKLVEEIVDLFRKSER
ncbi:hypothetical protein A2686_03950 [Candidatus Woesebacteria bacterium RIFCSPHIGHO2_01_FULL_38_10]|uniref:Transcriptional regulator n=1 Tax=Candidatus Woesebacteria bacterium RIFCSPLOWO2_01_FULL_39_10b TaxID=1802517 RepID=A0A1F8B7T8_9BACT|nr:MAG: hypothetical protein A2686_03950 [Candidatus Woesebacteria bacterium RIFCSPHIGHO2_01_FULL_38_10]OGM60000.1 MAG: hypothetical protein A2892_03835 [Candidatus Woesebacteria bacterium RIFCSPLOWO2_01_FULL_39_10b]